MRAIFCFYAEASGAMYVCVSSMFTGIFKKMFVKGHMNLSGFIYYHKFIACPQQPLYVHGLSQ
jgi:hypothetical protein